MAGVWHAVVTAAKHGDWENVFGLLVGVYPLHVLYPCLLLLNRLRPVCSIACSLG
jgi:hypothetical protein